VVATGATRVAFALASGASKPPMQVPVASEPSPDRTTATSEPSTTTTLDTVPESTPIAVPATGLGLGSNGPAVQAIKQRLTDLRYDSGPSNGRFNQQTSYAVLALEKVHGMARTGRVTQSVADAMVDLPPPLISGAEPSRVEVDLTRQVLFFWIDGRVPRILPVSSGFGGHYCGDDGSCGIAITPIGAYRATSKIPGWDRSPLGKLWNPVFFNHGIAIHGEPAAANAAFHGRVRIPMGDSLWLYKRLALGTAMYVADARHSLLAFIRGGSVGPVQPGGTPPTRRSPTAGTGVRAPRRKLPTPATPRASTTPAAPATPLPRPQPQHPHRPHAHPHRHRHPPQPSALTSHFSAVALGTWEHAGPHCG
jgi:peptidoglycan hydrolase-like protein with peptidoglycan-binding domain